MNWNFKEELVTSARQAVSGGTDPETTYYQYDSRGKRLRKITENSGTTGSTHTLKSYRIYIEGYEYAQTFSTGTTTTESTLSLIDTSTPLSAGSGQRFVMFENVTTVTSTTTTVYNLIQYQHPNHQGSCCLETDENGDVITYEEYHPFGTTSYQATNSTITAAAKRYRYTGMERDDETGLSYHNARYYIPWLGRWLNPDPIGIGDGVNVYAYCGGNPVNGTDTSGTQFNKPYVTKQDNARAQPSLSFQTRMQAGEKQAAANTANEAAQHNRQVNSNNSNFYGNNDPAFYAIKGDNEMAKFVATKDLAAKEGGAMGILIWVGYGLDKVGEYGSVVVATGGARGSVRLPDRESNNKAPIESVGKGAFKPDAIPFEVPHGGAQSNSSQRKAEPLTDPDVAGTIKIESAMGAAANGFSKKTSLETKANEKITTLEFFIGKSQWGWTGSPVWKNLVNQIKTNPGTITELLGKIPTKAEALQLLKEAGVSLDLNDIRIEGGHEPPNPHTYNHINYYTPSGNKATIQILEL